MYVDLNFQIRNFLGFRLTRVDEKVNFRNNEHYIFNKCLMHTLMNEYKIIIIIIIPNPNPNRKFFPDGNVLRMDNFLKFSSGVYFWNLEFQNFLEGNLNFRTVKSPSIMCWMEIEISANKKKFRSFLFLFIIILFFIFGTIIAV